MAKVGGRKVGISNRSLNTSINIGAMDRRVTLQTLSKVSDGMGGYSESWADVSDYWINVIPARERRVNEQGLEYDADTFVFIGWYDDLSAITNIGNKRFQDEDNNTYKIETITKADGKNRVMEFICTQTP